MMRTSVINHEIWFEVKERGQVGTEVKCLLKYGQGMEADGRLEFRKLRRATVIDPEGNEERLEIYIDQKGARDAYIASFIPKMEGLHILVAEYESGVFTVTKDGRFYPIGKDELVRKEIERSACSYQYCKSIVQIGEESERVYASPLNQELEIVPLNPRKFHQGDKIELEVIYEGKILPEVAVIAMRKGGERTDLRTDTEGRTALTVGKGLWMFLVKHVDRSKRTEKYDEKVITANLTLEVDG